MAYCPKCWDGESCKLIRWLTLRVLIAVLLFAVTVHLQQSIEYTIELVIDSQSLGVKTAVQWCISIAFFLLLIGVVYRIDVLSASDRQAKGVEAEPLLAYVRTSNTFV